MLSTQYFTIAIVFLGNLRQHFASAFVPLRQTSTATVSSRSSLVRQPPQIYISSKTINHKKSIQTELGISGVEGGIGDLWSSYLSALEAEPLLVKSLTAGVILGAADLSGQAIQQARAASSTTSSGGVDVARFLRFAFFGLALQAPWNHFYYLFLDGALPPTEDPFTTTTGIKVIIDQFIQAPIFTVLIFGFLGLLEGKSTEEIKRQLDEDYVDTMVANWKLWVPATVINIAFCPPILRVLFLNVVFFFWSIFLSLKLNKTEE